MLAQWDQFSDRPFNLGRSFQVSQPQGPLKDTVETNEGVLIDDDMKVRIHSHTRLAGSASAASSTLDP
jgi:hypothetical protein